MLKTIGLYLFHFVDYKIILEDNSIYLNVISEGINLVKAVAHQWENYLLLEMATHSSVLAWRIPGTPEPGGLLSMGSHRVRHN